jgi:acetoin utilization deacetylase AcuC-like enzyme
MLKVAWSTVFAHPLPVGHRFPMEKYNLLPEQLLYEGTLQQENFFEPEPLDVQYILNTHAAAYWHKLQNQQLTPSEIRKTGFPLSPELVYREVVIMNGTVQAALFALEYGVSMNIAGGTHHAFTDRGEGFCLLNDIAIAANYLLEKKLASRILIVDLDVHQGNGTAQIFRDKSEVFTFSMHGASNYPMHKEKSDLDVALPDGTTDVAYLLALDTNLPAIFEKHALDFIFYQSGVDVLATDKLGRLSLSLAGCRERDRKVLELCKKHHIPVAASMGGGYSERIADIVEAHANTFRLAQEIFF